MSWQSLVTIGILVLRPAREAHRDAKPIRSSDMTHDIRWKQRFHHFEKALLLLEQAMRIKDPNMIERAGMNQFFEMNSELAWNLIKDYLEDEGFIDIQTPKDAIKKGFEINLIKDGQAWMELLTDRNLTSHTYDEQTAIEVEGLIFNQYYPLLIDLYENFKRK